MKLTQLFEQKHAQLTLSDDNDRRAKELIIAARRTVYEKGLNPRNSNLIKEEAERLANNMHNNILQLIDEQLRMYSAKDVRR